MGASAVNADVRDSSEARVPLGQLLVEAGLLSPVDLELALAEQKGTNRPLGRILVERGFVAVPTIANALAEQHGGLLKTEYGFATGLKAKTTPRGDGQGHVVLPPLLPPTSPIALGRKPWREDDDLPPRRPKALARIGATDPAATPMPASEDDVQTPIPLLRTVPGVAAFPADADAARNESAVEAKSTQVVEPSADAAAALLLALNNDDGIDEIEALVEALRRAVASQGPAPVATAPVGGSPDSGAAIIAQVVTAAPDVQPSRCDAEPSANAAAVRVAELETEIASVSAARDEAVSALTVAQAAAATDRGRLEDARAELEHRASEIATLHREIADLRAASASDGGDTTTPMDETSCFPPPDADAQPDGDVVAEAGNAASGGIFAPPRLGELLVRGGRLTQQQLSEALVESRQTGDRLGHVLIRNGWVFEEELAQTLATQWQIPYVSLMRIGVDSSTASLLPRAIGLRFGMIPVRANGSSVQVAFADPSDEEALEATRRYLPSIDLAVAELSDIEMMWRSIGASPRSMYRTG